MLRRVVLLRDVLKSKVETKGGSARPRLEWGGGRVKEMALDMSNQS